VNDTERLWGLTLEDKFPVEQELEENLLDLDLLEEDAFENGDRSIWEEKDDNIVYDKDGATIKASSLNHLILKLTQFDANYDPQLMSVILLTYRTFTTPENFLKKLKERFQVPRLEGEKEDIWKTRKQKIQIRVIGALRKWISDYYEDFTFTDGNRLLKSLEDFISNVVEPDTPHLAVPLRTTLQNKADRSSNEKERKIRDFGKAPPEPKVSFRTIFSPSLDLFECDEEEISRQLTIIEFDIYSSIESSEFLNLSWSKANTKHRSPGILRMIDRSTRLSQWVATCILKEERIRKRAKLLGEFIKIAQHLFYNYNNFSTCMAIIAGLGGADVHRLKWTFAELPKSATALLSELRDKLSANKSYGAYRAILAAADPPCIPYLGTYLTDLTFIEENKDITKRGLINFTKRRLIYDVIEKIQRYQQKAYNLQPVQQIIVLLETKALYRVDEDERFRLSLLREPRDAERAQIL